MTKQELIQKCLEYALKAQEQRQANKATLDANNGPAQPADVFLFKKMPDKCGITGFAITHAHPDNKGDLCFPDPEDLFFLVPMDWMTAFVGLTDVVERNNQFQGDVVLRCGNGLWITRQDIDKRMVRVGLVDPMPGKTCDRCRKKLGQMVRGKLEGTSSQWENNASPDYDDWADEVQAWVNKFRNDLT
jgi:hypothetical protein